MYSVKFSLEANEPLLLIESTMSSHGMGELGLTAIAKGSVFDNWNIVWSVSLEHAIPAEFASAMNDVIYAM